ncbi:low specificity L-threonine aldolase [Chelatococcus sambhunathii]|uniref:Low specificity L-threonine aldolase n=1 Tax=Chelatococcus sambhunathii TaxID=363953 RepID=A0ABU1DGD4_9HYPH|nr:beta-eliminating lyase-related protein [Chelatococcus sambhunathii]MDR4307105.1 low specificity L-threonine aldolase [Chelatococcus sambhunathii]
MNLTSDNIAPAHPAVLEALAAANSGPARPYGHDEENARVEALLSDVFEKPVAAFLVTTGTAANALSLAQMTPPWGAVIGHEEAHVMHDECGAPEFFTNGAKIVGAPGLDGKLTTETFGGLLGRDFWTPPTHVTPAALTLSQATEAGTVYRPAEIGALSEIARGRRIRVHMDGARFANAVASTHASPADLTWRSGVEALSFGFTKNGAMAAEAIVLFAEDLIQNLAERRKRGGHTWSKGRFIAAQIAALLEGGLWLDLARSANARAAELALGLEARGLRTAFPVEANEVFVWLPAALHEALKARGAGYYVWTSESIAPERAGGDGEVIARMIASFATTGAEVQTALTEIDAALAVAAPRKRAPRPLGAPLF